jgi:hypothetical protein
MPRSGGHRERGGYQLEQTGIQLFERVEGDHFVILGRSPCRCCASPAGGVACDVNFCVVHRGDVDRTLLGVKPDSTFLAKCFSRGGCSSSVSPARPAWESTTARFFIEEGVPV